MKSKKITSIKQARKVIEQSGILQVGGKDGTVNSDYVSWWQGDEYRRLGYLYRERKSSKVYLMIDPNPSDLRAIAKVFNYEIVCAFYGGFEYCDTSILWLKEAVNECTSR